MSSLNWRTNPRKQQEGLREFSQHLKMRDVFYKCHVSVSTKTSAFSCQLAWLLPWTCPPHSLRRTAGRRLDAWPRGAALCPALATSPRGPRVRLGIPTLPRASAGTLCPLDVALTVTGKEWSRGGWARATWPREATSCSCTGQAWPPLLADPPGHCPRPVTGGERRPGWAWPFSLLREMAADSTCRSEFTRGTFSTPGDYVLNTQKKSKQHGSCRLPVS